MGRADMVIQGAVGTIGRRCVLCGKRWDAKHPNDPNIFCEKCTQRLRELTEDKNEGDDG